MAAPNIAALTIITGISTFVGLTTTNSVSFLSNASGSNKVLKVNTILAANTSAITQSVSVKIFNLAAGAGSSVSIASSISVPTASTVVVLGKDTPIYLQENQSLAALAGYTNAVDIVCSYEEIS